MTQPRFPDTLGLYPYHLTFSTAPTATSKTTVRRGRYAWGRGAGGTLVMRLVQLYFEPCDTHTVCFASLRDVDVHVFGSI